MEGAKDGIHIRSVSEISFMDRLRILISGKVQLVSKTVCENQIGNNITVSCLSVLPPKFLDRNDR